MRWPTRACGGKRLAVVSAVAISLCGPGFAAAQKFKVPTAPPQKAQATDFRDSKFGVRFKVPPGWNLTKKDGQVSTFRLDARSATGKSEMRAVASLEFNPFPQSTFSGALFYYSVERHATDRECVEQASGTAAEPSSTPVLAPSEHVEAERDTQNIGGMDFIHGHDEHGSICVEARDEVYTAYRKGSCYRFDLAMNTFCSISSGAQEITRAQLHDIDERMTAILSSVALDWEKGGPHVVPVPETPAEKQPGLPVKVPAQVAAAGS